ncbi:MAG: hypothetical protein Q7K57_30525 [Burkholderiaceae bacterium]|nr:hypothetical protein [Burkholderiaceae bacterium]
MRIQAGAAAAAPSGPNAVNRSNGENKIRYIQNPTLRRGKRSHFDVEFLASGGIARVLADTMRRKNAQHQAVRI